MFLKKSDSSFESLFVQLIDTYIQLFTNPKNPSLRQLAFSSFLTFYTSTFKSISFSSSSNSISIFSKIWLCLELPLTSSMKRNIKYFFTHLHAVQVDESLASLFPPVKGIEHNTSFESYISIYLLDLLTCDDDDIVTMTKKSLLQTLHACGL